MEPAKKNMIKIEGVTDAYANAVHYHLVDGLSQREACEKAGLSGETRKDVFQRHPEVRKAIEQYMIDNPPPVPEEKQQLIDFYRKVINAPYNTPVNEITPPKGYEGNWVGSITTEEKWSTKTNGTQALTHRTIKYRNVSESDRINAAKELSILLGLREEKMKVDSGDDLMKAVQRRRAELAATVETLVE